MQMEACIYSQLGFTVVKANYDQTSELVTTHFIQVLPTNVSNNQKQEWSSSDSRLLMES